MNKLVEEIIKPILEANPQIKKVVGVYGGRFQPFGPHHYKTYKWLAKQVDDAYITTSNIKKPPRHPMNFKEKVRHMSKMGVPSSKIIEEKSPYKAMNLTKKYNSDTTAFVYVFGAKDAGRLGGGGKYFQDYKKNIKNLKGYEENGYYLTAPHVSISVGGKEVSGTSMRELLGSDKFDDSERTKLFKSMFGYYDKGVFQMMVNKFKKLFEDVDFVFKPTKIKKLKKKFKDGKGKELIKGQMKENISSSQLAQVEKYLDRLWSKVGVDIEFTRHFMDRVNDTRNNKPINSAEVMRIFKQTFKKYGKQIPKLGKDAEALMKDMKTDVNVPFVLKWDGKEFDLIAKTIMRKKNFKSSNKKFAVEGKLEESKKEFVIWGIPPGKSSEDILYTKAKSQGEAKKVVKVLTDKHGVKKARIQVLDLEQDPSKFWKSDKVFEDITEAFQKVTVKDKKGKSHTQQTKIRPGTTHVLIIHWKAIPKTSFSSAQKAQTSLNFGTEADMKKMANREKLHKDRGKWIKGTEIKKLDSKYIKEGVDLPIEIGDTVRMGKFKNKKVVIKTIDWNEKGDLLINGRPAMKFRLEKKAEVEEGYPNEEDMKKIRKRVKKARSQSDSNKEYQYHEIQEFLTTIDMSKIIKEITSTATSGKQGVDSGPSALMGGMGGYTERNKEWAEKLGWEVVNYILDVDVSKIPPFKGEFGGGKSVSYLPAGIGTGGTPNNPENLAGGEGYNKWVKNMKKVAQEVGFKLVNFMDKDEKVLKKQIAKDTAATLKQQKSDEKDIKDIKVEESVLTKEWWEDNLTEVSAKTKLFKQKLMRRGIKIRYDKAKAEKDLVQKYGGQGEVVAKKFGLRKAYYAVPKKGFKKDTKPVLKINKQEMEKLHKDKVLDKGNLKVVFSEAWWKENLLTEGGVYVDEEKGLVMCGECGDWMKQIQYRHLKYKHNLTMEEYRNKYPNIPLLAESLKNTESSGKNPMSDDNVRKKHLETVTSDTYKKNHSKVMVGKGVGVKRPDVSIKNKTTHRELMFDNGVWTRPEDKPQYQRYVEEVRAMSNDNFGKFYYQIENSDKGRDKHNWHLDHKVSIREGFDKNIPVEVISHHCNLRVIPASENISKSYKSNILFEDLLTDIEYSDNPLDTRILLQCGGAYGHMAHPFDDKDLTFGDLKKIIEDGLGGTLNREDNVTEKLDGQNIMISWKDGKLIAARNKGHIKNGGKTALTKSGIKSKFKGRGDIANAFNFAMNDLEKAIKGLSDKQKEKIFNNGYNFMNMEVMWPMSANVIDYDVATLVFHGALIYDDNGTVKGEVKGSARILAGMIKQVNKHIGKKYSIGKPNFLDVPKNQDFGKLKGKFIGKLNKLKDQYALKDSDTLGLYHQSYWEEYIFNAAQQFGYEITDDILENLTKRWAFFDKSYKIATIKKDLKEESEFLAWVLSTDKDDHSKMVKENMKPFEVLFFAVGAEILKNVKGFMAANPDKAVQGIRKRIDKAISDVKGGKDLKKLNTLKLQLDKLNAIGGLDSIVPSEGIVFKYKGNTYKFTGAFAPINQITGLIAF